jgi:peptide/nickel transport system permease protein
MGTDSNAADVASQMIHASRTALTIGFIATGIALVIGVVIGGLMGFFSGWIDLLGMRLVEIFSAIPKLFLLLSFVAFFPDNPKLALLPGREIEISRMYAIMAIIGLTSWVSDARFIRAEFLKLRKQDFVTAAVACALPLKSILFRHMLPNGVTPVLVAIPFGVAGAILSETFLSFLGLGLTEDPSWGHTLSHAVGSAGAFYWWLATFPGLAIFFTVMAYNLLGEALRDALDPQSQSKPHP